MEVNEMNNLKMVSDLIKDLTEYMKNNGDLPVFLFDSDSVNAMVPYKSIELIEVSAPDAESERAILLGNCKLTDVE
jgi:hypothetical protein